MDALLRLRRQLVLAFILLGTLQCGHDKSSPSPSPTPSDKAGSIPSGWDGQSDWTGSALKAVDE